MFNIDKNIPVLRKQGCGRPKGSTMYPFKQMQPGDSIFVANSPEQPRASMNAAKAAAIYASKTFGVKVITRKSTENGSIGRRIWLVKP